eukprot:1156319-Pelagomonas_calceolata.AAC.4
MREECWHLGPKTSSVCKSQTNSKAPVACLPEPTIISPKQYMRRFRTAIMSYFTVVPGSAFVSPSLPSDM